MPDKARSITIEVYGTPAPGGSKTVFGKNYTDACKGNRPWRAEVVKAVAAMFNFAWAVIPPKGKMHIAFAGGKPDPWPIFPKGVAVECSIVFWMPRPKYHFAKDGLIKPKYLRVYHVKTPDVDKLVRSTKDALTDSGIWRDDSQDIGGNKVKYFHPPDRAPGATIRIAEVMER